MRNVAKRLEGIFDAQVPRLAATEPQTIGVAAALAVTTAARSQALSDIPTVSESVPGYEAISLFGIGTPKNTPAEIVDKLNKEINLALLDAKIESHIIDVGAAVLATSPSEFGKLLADETEKMGKGDRGSQH